ncbi:MAG: response regulator [Sedimentisphaerales bacterium]|nr:response regulator [Sedimentisphaerales bacterium]
MESDKSGMKSSLDKPPQTGKPRVLLLRSSGGADKSDLLETLRSNLCFDLSIAHNMDEALRLLEQQSFDAVFTDTTDFLPLERASVSDQSLSILNNIGEGVCIVDRGGTVLWANSKMESFSDSVRQGISERGRQAFDFFDRQYRESSPGMGSDVLIRSRKYSFTHEQSNRYFEMIVNPMKDEQGPPSRIAMVIWEDTASRRLQQRIDAIDKAGRELVRLEAETLSAMTVEERINLLQNKIIRYARKLLHFDHFAIRLLNRRTNQLEVLFGMGLPGDTQTEVFANVEHNGISGYVAATGRSYICNNPSTDTRYLPGLDGACCSLTVPLLLHDKVIGTLNVESDKEQAFIEDDRQMAEIFGRYIAIAMNILDLLVVERYQTTGQAADTLNQQISEPLNGILTKASLLMEDYIGHDDIRRRLQGIIDHVVNMKAALKETRKRPKGIFDTHVGKDITPDPQLTSRHILVVDDEEFIRRTIADIVRKYGCTADTAQDGREAKALIRQRTYDLVISDIKLPYADGYEIFATARSLSKSIPVILMTGFGYDPNHSIVRANREGLSAVLYKPFKVEQLMKEIRRALKESKV